MPRHKYSLCVQGTQSILLNARHKKSSIKIGQLKAFNAPNAGYMKGDINRKNDKGITSECNALCLR